MAFSSMYTGAAGLKAHGTLMQQISANLANVSTTAYKSGDTFLETLNSQSKVGSISGVVAAGGSNTVGQIGHGARVSATRINFEEGSFEKTSSSTDLAIGGQGFFRVATPAGNKDLYTRAGNFIFDKNGQLVDAHGNILQGYPIDNDGNIGTTSGNIALPMKTEKNASGQDVLVVKSDPKATTDVSIRTNLDSGSVDNSETEGSPFFSLMQAWDGTSDVPLDSEQYAYNTSIKVYDKNGNTHDLVVYYDKVVNDGDPSDKMYWEYIVTVPPGSDGRAATEATSAAGLLMTGTLTFSGDGTLLNQSAYTLADGASDPKDLNNWTTAAMNSNGLPIMNATFKGIDGETSEQTLSLNMGIQSSTDTWTLPGTTAASVGSNASNLAVMDSGRINALSTTAYYGSSSTISQSQNGFGEGYLQNVDFDSDGIMTAHFSNGLSQGLYQVNLYNFKSEFGLRREGSNYFSSTPASGEAIEGVGGKNGMGSVVGSNLETSNVDLAEEFAHMILTQRGYQANSKTITTTDQLINTTLGVKK
ncbi:flagellar hook-basal body complex protein [Maridesulfovibrio sp.]|uniref:flagellar hook protein FlgE n=1 Tax=Maridesulfovibrio sp. TaxID=2795000 RepID=UPI002A18D325|nr:flagellar hook-basal body complex protein [Maridesulfovibrio sp.]